MGRCVRLILAMAVAVSGGLAVRADDQPVRKGTKAGSPPAALRETLKDKAPKARLKAAQGLVETGEWKTTSPVLVDLLKTPEPDVADQAARDAATQVGSIRLKTSLPALIALLKDENGDVRLRAVRVLGTCRRPLEPLLPSCGAPRGRPATRGPCGSSAGSAADRPSRFTDFPAGTGRRFER